jgi:hypothetical protein
MGLRIARLTNLGRSGRQGRHERVEHVVALDARLAGLVEHAKPAAGRLHQCVEQRGTLRLRLRTRLVALGIEAVHRRAPGAQCRCRIDLDHPVVAGQVEPLAALITDLLEQPGAAHRSHADAVRRDAQRSARDAV